MDEHDTDPRHYYELNEGDGEVFSDLLLAHDTEYDEEEFLELVLAARRRVIDTFEEDTLSEAIARDLARTAGFTVIDDRRLRVAVTVSAEEGETRVVGIDERSGALADDGDPDEEFRSLVLDVDKEDRRWGDR
ncbi:MAG: hypothetical protein ACKOTZ_03930 [Chloroflexota bacterium]